MTTRHHSRSLVQGPGHIQRTHMTVTRVERLAETRRGPVGYEPCHLAHSARIALGPRHHNALEYALVEQPVACAYIHTVTQTNQLALFVMGVGIQIYGLTMYTHAHRMIRGL